MNLIRNEWQMSNLTGPYIVEKLQKNVSRSTLPELELKGLENGMSSTAPPILNSNSSHRGGQADNF